MDKNREKLFENWACHLGLKIKLHNIHNAGQRLVTLAYCAQVS